MSLVPKNIPPVPQDPNSLRLYTEKYLKEHDPNLIAGEDPGHTHTTEPADGTVAGQMLYWDGTAWVRSDEDYLSWDAANNKHTIEIVLTKRLLAGGVLT